MLDRIREIKGPRPILSRRAEESLTGRQREILDELGELFLDGFRHLTMADLAASLNCSLRTLYGLAPSRDDLVLLVVDRNLWKTGAVAMRSIDDAAAPLDAIRTYLTAANTAVATTTEPFAADCAADPATHERQTEHSEYLIAVTRTLLDMAVEAGDVDPIDTSAAARVLAGLGAEFSRPDVLPTIRGSAGDTATEMMGVILDGLRRHRSAPEPR